MENKHKERNIYNDSVWSFLVCPGNYLGDQWDNGSRQPELFFWDYRFNHPSFANDHTFNCCCQILYEGVAKRRNSTTNQTGTAKEEKIAKMFFQKLFDNKEENRYKLRAPSLKESKEECAKIQATDHEIKKAKEMVRYICETCGYHKDKSWDGKLRKCNACGDWLRYWRLAERITHLREI